jgi:hypothetical protein
MATNLSVDQIIIIAAIIGAVLLIAFTTSLSILLHRCLRRRARTQSSKIIQSSIANQWCTNTNPYRDTISRPICSGELYRRLPEHQPRNRQPLSYLPSYTALPTEWAVQNGSHVPRPRLLKKARSSLYRLSGGEQNDNGEAKPIVQKLESSIENTSPKRLSAVHARRVRISGPSKSLNVLPSVATPDRNIVLKGLKDAGTRNCQGLFNEDKCSITPIFQSSAVHHTKHCSISGCLHKGKGGLVSTLKPYFRRSISLPLNSPGAAPTRSVPDLPDLSNHPKQHGRGFGWTPQRHSISRDSFVSKTTVATSILNEFSPGSKVHIVRDGSNKNNLVARNGKRRSSVPELPIQRKERKLDKDPPASNLIAEPLNPNFRFPIPLNTGTDSTRSTPKRIYPSTTVMNLAPQFSRLLQLESEVPPFIQHRNNHVRTRDAPLIAVSRDDEAWGVFGYGNQTQGPNHQNNEALSESPVRPQSRILRELSVNEFGKEMGDQYEAKNVKSRANTAVDWKFPQQIAKHDRFKAGQSRHSRNQTSLKQPACSSRGVAWLPNSNNNNESSGLWPTNSPFTRTNLLNSRQYHYPKYSNNDKLNMKQDYSEWPEIENPHLATPTMHPSRRRSQLDPHRLSNLTVDPPPIKLQPTPNRQSIIFPFEPPIAEDEEPLEFKPYPIRRPSSRLDNTRSSIYTNTRNSVGSTYRLSFPYSKLSETSGSNRTSKTSFRVSACLPTSPLEYSTYASPSDSTILSSIQRRLADDSTSPNSLELTPLDQCKAVVEMFPEPLSVPTLRRDNIWTQKDKLNTTISTNTAKPERSIKPPHWDIQTPDASTSMNPIASSARSPYWGLPPNPRSWRNALLSQNIRDASLTIPQSQHQAQKFHPRSPLRNMYCNSNSNTNTNEVAVAASTPSTTLKDTGDIFAAHTTTANSENLSSNPSPTPEQDALGISIVDRADPDISQGQRATSPCTPLTVRLVNQLRRMDSTYLEFPDQQISFVANGMLPTVAPAASTANPEDTVAKPAQQIRQSRLCQTDDNASSKAHRRRSSQYGPIGAERAWTYRQRQRQRHKHESRSWSGDASSGTVLHNEKDAHQNQNQTPSQKRQHTRQAVGLGLDLGLGEGDSLRAAAAAAATVAASDFNFGFHNEQRPSMGETVGFLGMGVCCQSNGLLLGERREKARPERDGVSVKVNNNSSAANTVASSSPGQIWENEVF